MRTRRTPLPLWQLGLPVAGLCLVCLILLARGPARSDGAAEPLDGSAVVLWEQASEGGSLMSCADEPSSSSEPLWCESPGGPECSRGAHTPAGSESWLGSVVTFPLASPALPRCLGVLTDASKSPLAALGPKHAQQKRLERPPRRA